MSRWPIQRPLSGCQAAGVVRYSLPSPQPVTARSTDPDVQDFPSTRSASLTGCYCSSVWSGWPRPAPRARAAEPQPVAYVSAALRHAVQSRAGNRCEYCRLPQSLQLNHPDRLMERLQAPDDEPPA